jgi:hypothetical protein
MRQLIISSLLCLTAWPCLADSGTSIPAASTVLDAEDVQPIVALENFPTISEISDAVFGVPLPRPRSAALQRSRATMQEVCATLAAAARQHSVPTRFFIRLIWQESRFDPLAVSPVGAQGVAQFMPQVAYAMGLDDPFDPIEALPVSARLLRELLVQFENNLGLAAAAYNAGPKRIFDWLKKGATLPEETRDYVRIITGHAPDRWRSTKPGRLDLDVPQRAPCHAVAGSDADMVVLVPAPVEAKKAKLGKAAGEDTKTLKVTSNTKRRSLVLKARKSLTVRKLAAKVAKRSSIKLASTGRR